MTFILEQILVIICTSSAMYVRLWVDSIRYDRYVCVHILMLRLRTIQHIIACPSVTTCVQTMHVPSTILDYSIALFILLTHFRVLFVMLFVSSRIPDFLVYPLQSLDLYPLQLGESISISFGPFSRKYQSNLSFQYPSLPQIRSTQRHIPLA